MRLKRFLIFFFRGILTFVVAIFLLFGVVGFFYYEKIIVFIIKLIDLGEVNIVFTSPFQFLNLGAAIIFS